MSVPNDCGKRLSDFVYEWADASPDSCAWTDASGSGTYKDLQQLVTDASRALITLGINPGDRVAMLSAPRIEFWVIFLATVNIGATWVGLDPRFRAEEMRFVIDETSPKVVFEAPSREDPRPHAELEAALKATSAPVEFIAVGDDDLHRFLGLADGVLAVEMSHRRKRVKSTDPAMVVFTSGTTGTPKGALISHRGLVFTAGLPWPTREPAEKIRTIMNMPINHVGAFSLICVPALHFGGSLVFQERFDPVAVLRSVEEQQITYLANVPTAFQLLAAHSDWEVRDLASLVRICIGGGAISAEGLLPYVQMDIAVVVVYGLTEASGTVTCSDDNASLQVLTETIGRPVPEAEIRIEPQLGTDSSGGGGLTGELCVRHAGVFIGYLNNPVATRAAITDDGFLRTGDLVTVDPAGNLRLRGRIGQMYKSGGYNVYPSEIVSVLECHPAILLASVVAIPDVLFGSVGVAYLQIRPGQHLSVGEISSWCREQLANYKVPKAFRVLESMPLLPIGKIDNSALRQRARTEFVEDVKSI